MAIPKCIAAEGDATPIQLETCSDRGLLKHVGGIRGIRAEWTQDGIQVKDKGNIIYISGKVKYTPLTVGM
jgi:hypothetical protein